MPYHSLITRHHYLNNQLSSFNPATINMCIETAMEDASKRIFFPKTRPDPPNFANFPIESEHFGMKIFKGKLYPLAYGFGGLKKIIHEIGSNSPIKVYEALSTLADLLYDPIEYERALHEFSVVKRLEDAFFRCLPMSSGRTLIFDLIVENLVILSSRFDGAKLMMKQYNLIDAIYQIILCKNTVSTLGSKILKNLSKFPSVAEEMVYLNHFGKLKAIFNEIPSASEDGDLFEHLAQLIYIDPVSAINEGYFKFLLNKINNESALLKLWLKCFSLMLDCENGQKEADENDVVKILHDFLLSIEGIDDEVLEYVVLALQNSTFTERSLWRCREFSDFPQILLRTAFTKTNFRLQIYSLQTLRNISAMPSFKDYMRKVCKRTVMKISCLSETAEKLKEKLLDWLRKKVYINIDEEKVFKCKIDEEKPPSELICPQ